MSPLLFAIVVPFKITVEGVSPNFIVHLVSSLLCVAAADVCLASGVGVLVVVDSLVLLVDDDVAAVLLAAVVVQCGDSNLLFLVSLFFFFSQ